MGGGSDPAALFNSCGMHMMKFQTYTHHLFDAIRRGRILSACYSDDRPRLVDMWQCGLAHLERVPTYVVREPVNDIFDNDLLVLANEWTLAGKARLPVPEMLVQFRLTNRFDPDHPERPPPEDIWIVYAATQEALRVGNLFHVNPEVLEGEPGAIWMFVASTVITELGDWATTPLVVRYSEVSRGLQIYAIMRGVDPVREYAKDIEDDMIDAASWLLGTVFMMESPSIELEAVKVPKQVNRGRSLLKKSRIPDHTIIRLPRIFYTTPAGDGGMGGTHRRPRVHWRRSHDREYRPGKFTHIPLTLVAKKEGEPLPPPPVVEIVTNRP
jgi:hypothetical protein